MKKLTTAEQAHLLSLQQAFDEAKRARDAFVHFLANQHEIKPDEWQLDLAAGAWVKKEIPDQ